MFEQTIFIHTDLRKQLKLQQYAARPVDDDVTWWVCCTNTVWQSTIVVLLFVHRRHSFRKNCIASLHSDGKDGVVEPVF